LVSADKQDMEIASIGLQGMQAAESRVNRAASRLAAVSSPEGDQVDLSAEMVALMAAKQSFQASAKVVATADDLSRATIDLLG
jgi:flagellar hook protein FlgE